MWRRLRRFFQPEDGWRVNGLFITYHRDNERVCMYVNENRSYEVYGATTFIVPDRLYDLVRSSCESIEMNEL